MNGGIYIAVFHLPRPRRVRVGKLGSHRFAAGWYLYVGTAQRNLEARLARHARRAQRLPATPLRPIKGGPINAFWYK